MTPPRFALMEYDNFRAWPSSLGLKGGVMVRTALSFGKGTSKKK